MNVPATDSIKKRYIFSLVVNILLCVPRFLTASLIPRALGPAAYGDYQFLINNLTSIKNFLDFGTSTAFFTYNAKTEESSSLNIQYLLWWFFQLALIASGVFFAYSLGVYTHIWPGQDIENISLAAISVWLFLFAQQLVQFGDSKGLTILCQKTNLFANYSAAGLLALLYWRGSINIKTAMLIYITGPVILIIFLLLKFYKKYFITGSSISTDLAKNYAYFKNFCAPLVTVTIVGFLADFLDRWMLQKFAGSAAQGYYSLSYNWAAIALIFFNPMLNIFWREASIEVANKNNKKVSEIFLRFTKTAFFLTSFISFFLAFNAQNLISLIAGKTFIAAKFSFITMLFYPMAQVNGQLVGCLFFAYEDVKKYRNYSIVFMLIGTIATYFLMAPRNLFIPGFGTDHSTFALKTLLAGFIGSDILIYKMSEKLKFDYLSLIKHRLQIIFFFVLICYTIQFVLNGVQNVILLTLIWLILYSTIVFFSIYNWPELTGVSNLKFYIANFFNNSKNSSNK
ncbi:MAG: oligosaccharide flippase family protein [Bacteroidales bacterium]|nr:oligosaccharide flippase family protein [Bacteroidales bacterium]